MFQKDKYLILNGHHRYYALLKKKTKKVSVIVEREIRKVKKDKYKRYYEVGRG